MVTLRALALAMPTLILAAVLHGCAEPQKQPEKRHYADLPAFPFWRLMEPVDTAAITREIDSLDIVLLKDTLNAPAFVRRGQLKFIRSGDLGLSDFNKAIALDSTNPQAYFSRGVVYQYLESRHPPFRGCRDIRKAVELGFVLPSDLPDLWSQCSVRDWDTLVVGDAGKNPWMFISLSAFLYRSPYTEEERNLIHRALITQSLPVDSMWIQISHMEPPDSTMIELGLFHRSGILKAITLEKRNVLMAGNWSGMDGTLSIERSTGRSSYLLWQ